MKARLLIILAAVIIVLPVIFSTGCSPKQSVAQEAESHSLSAVTRLGNYEKRDCGRSYQAETDGFVIAQIIAEPQLNSDELPHQGTIEGHDWT